MRASADLQRADDKKSTLLLLQEVIDIDSRLLEDGAQGAFGHIAPDWESWCTGSTPG